MTAGQIVQVALCSSDLVGTTRVLCDGLGFAQAGSRFLWGPRIAHIQGLSTADLTAMQVSWMVGRQDFVQVELFCHSEPAQRPAPPDRLPSDLGWSRWGVATTRFDATLARLSALGIEPLTAPVDLGRGRVVCFREPGSTVVVELLERGPEALEPGFTNHFMLHPSLAYAAATVSDLAATRQVFAVLGMTELPADTLHNAEHEQLWGVPGAQRETTVLRSGSVLLELSAYERPTSRAQPTDHRLSDQGFMNIAVGFRRPEDLETAYDRLLELGATCPIAPPAVPGGIYVTLPDGLSLELLWVPREYDGHYGFEPLPMLGHPPVWPRVQTG